MPEFHTACGTEATRVRGRYPATGYWWCWKCQQALKPAEMTTMPPVKDQPKENR